MDATDVNAVDRIGIGMAKSDMFSSSQKENILKTKADESRTVDNFAAKISLSKALRFCNAMKNQFIISG